MTIKTQFEVNLFPRPYGVAAYAVGERLLRLRLPENKVIYFSGSWEGLEARRIGGFSSVQDVREWCKRHHYPRPESPCVPLIIGIQEVPNTSPLSPFQNLV